MALTYDQKSEIRMAFDEAYVPPERRRDLRVQHRVTAEIAPLKRHKQGLPFTVQVEDFSPGGVGIVHTSALRVGEEFTLKVPRVDRHDLVVVLTVARCSAQADGTFRIGMELSSVMDRSSMNEYVDSIHRDSRVTSRRTKVLLLLLGIFGISTSLWMI